MEYASPSKEELLASIKPDMRLTKSFIKKIYGYGVTDASFSDKVIAALEAAGCSKARAYYESWVNEYEAAHSAELKEVAQWYRLECEKQWEKMRKEGEERRKQEEMKKYLQKKSDRELLSLLKRLN